MTTTIPDLWSDDIKVDILTPLVILRSQESGLEKRTQGILRAQVFTTTGDEWVQHQLDLIAPVLDCYRITLLTAKHHKDRVYPVTIHSEGFIPYPKPRSAVLTAVVHPLGQPPDQREATTQDQFIDLVRQVLHSGYARSLIQSLIARSNEMRGGPPQTPATKDGE